MKKTILTACLASTMLLAGANLASAELTDVNTYDPNNPDKFKTNVEIEFEKSGTDIIDGPFKDRLAIVTKPSTIKFGKSKITGSAVVAKGDVGGGDAYLVVNDDRKNTKPIDPNTGQEHKNDEMIKGGKWVLKAKMEELKNVADNQTIPAKMAMNFENPKSYDIGTKLKADGDIDPNVPTEDGANATVKPFAPGKGGNITVFDGVTLEAGGNEEAVLSKTERGDEEGVATKFTGATLTTTEAVVNSKSGKYTSKVVWTLYAGLQ